MRRTTIFAVIASVLMLGMAASPAAAGGSASSSDGAEFASTGTWEAAGLAVQDNTTDDNTTDSNTSDDNTTDSNTTDGNTTDGNTTDDNTTDDGDNATAFGQEVSAFVHQLQDSNNTSDAPLGVQVAAFVVANNPGNAPDHAGPPAWLVNDSVNKTTGPPEHAGPPENKSGGPPDDKGGGPPGDKGKDKGGPPDDKGGGPPGEKGNGN